MKLHAHYAAGCRLGTAPAKTKVGAHGCDLAQDKASDISLVDIFLFVVSCQV